MQDVANGHKTKEKRRLRNIEDFLVADGTGAAQGVCLGSFTPDPRVNGAPVDVRPNHTSGRDLQVT